MDRTLIITFTVAITAVLLFVLPLVATAERTDDITQQTVQSATTEFVNDIVTTGKITKDKYDDFIQTLNATGNTYNAELRVDVLDENVGKKTAQTQQTKIGENVYYTIYTSQIEEQLSTNGVYTCQKGDIVSVDVKNTNTTIAQIFTSAFYYMVGSDSYSIAASDSGIVTGKGSSSTSVSAVKTATTEINTATPDSTPETNTLTSESQELENHETENSTPETNTTKKEYTCPGGTTETASEWCAGGVTRYCSGGTSYIYCTNCGYCPGTISEQVKCAGCRRTGTFAVGYSKCSHGYTEEHDYTNGCKHGYTDGHYYEYTYTSECEHGYLVSHTYTE